MSGEPREHLVDTVANELIAQMEVGRGDVNDLCRACLWAAAGAVIGLLEVDEEGLPDMREAWAPESRREAQALLALWSSLTIDASLPHWSAEYVDQVIKLFVDDMFDGIGDQVVRLVGLIRAQDEDDQPEDQSERAGALLDSVSGTRGDSEDDQAYPQNRKRLRIM